MVLSSHPRLGYHLGSLGLADKYKNCIKTLLRIYDNILSERNELCDKDEFGEIASFLMNIEENYGSNKCRHHS